MALCAIGGGRRASWKMEIEFSDNRTTYVPLEVIMSIKRTHDGRNWTRRQAGVDPYEKRKTLCVRTRRRRPGGRRAGATNKTRTTVGDGAKSAATGGDARRFVYIFVSSGVSKGSRKKISKITDCFSIMKSFRHFHDNRVRAICQY